jgi:hypothetical protein
MSLIVATVCLALALQVATESSQTPSPDSTATQSPQNTDTHDRIFGVMPNYTTVEKSQDVPPIPPKQMFKLAALGSFDPFVYPFVALTTEVARLQNQEPSWGSGPKGYTRRYVAAFSVNTIGNFMTTAIMPTLFKQDPRYFELGNGSILHRVAYAASRSVVTRSRIDGRPEFNVSELAGNATGAGLSNIYHPTEDRTVSGTVTRWASQVMWDTLTNELKEFWPDIRQRLHHKSQ